MDQGMRIHVWPLTFVAFTGRFLNQNDEKGYSGIKPFARKAGPDANERLGTGLNSALKARGTRCPGTLNH